MIGTEIGSLYSERTVKILRTEFPDHVDVDVSAGHGSSVGVSEADFLAAVASELNVRIIERSELPPVTVDGSTVFAGEWTWEASGEDAPKWSDVLANVAVFEHFKANPPVDREQVAKIGASLAAEDKSLGRHLGTTLAQYDEIARSLYRAGVRVVTS